MIVQRKQVRGTHPNTNAAIILHHKNLRDGLRFESKDHCSTMAISSVEFELPLLSFGPDVRARELRWYIRGPVRTIHWWVRIGIRIQSPDIEISERTQLEMRINAIHDKYTKQQVAPAYIDCDYFTTIYYRHRHYRRAASWTELQIEHKQNDMQI